MEQTISVTILKAESRRYKNKEGEEKYYNQIAVLADGELVEMTCTKDIADYVLKNIDSLKGREIDLEVKARGFECLKILV